MIHFFRTSLTEVPPLSNSNLVDFAVEKEIRSCEKWKILSIKITKIALLAIAAQLICTIIFFALPVIPAIGACSLVTLLTLAFFSDGSWESRFDCLRGIASILGFATLPCLYLGHLIAEGIYTQQIAIIVGLTNVVFFSCTVPLFASSCLLYFINYKKIKFYKNIYEHLKIFHETKNYELPCNIKKFVAYLYSITYLQKYKKDPFFILPRFAEEEMNRLSFLK
jgi:hypothetical protein